MANIYRQGDIILTEVSNLPKGLVRVSDELRLCGETGNAHTLQAKVYEKPAKAQVIVKERPQVQTWVVLPEARPMVHPEHPAHLIPAGTYAVSRERTYTYEKVREVVD